MESGELYYCLAPEVRFQYAEDTLDVRDGDDRQVLVCREEAALFFRSWLGELRQRPRASPVLRRCARLANQEDRFDLLVARGIIVPTTSPDYFDDGETFAAIRAHATSNDITFHFRGGSYDLVAGIPPQEFVSSIGIAEHTLVFLRDVKCDYYRSLGQAIPSFEHLVAWQRGIIDALGRGKRINVIGSSMGGYAAIRSGALLSADRIVAFSPVASPHDAIPLDEFLRRDGLGVKQCDIWYGEGCEIDREVAVRFDGIPCCVLHPVATADHGTLLRLWREGALPALFASDESRVPVTESQATERPEREIEVAAEVLTFLRSRSRNANECSLQVNTPLVGSGLLDSFDFMALVAFVDRRFNVSIDLGAASTPLDTVATLARAIVARGSAGRL